MNSGQSSSPRYCLRHARRGFYVEELRADNDFRPPIWVSWGPVGPTFKTKEEARQWMEDTTEDRMAGTGAYR